MTVRYKTVKIPDNLHRRIKTYCAHTEQEMSTWCGMVLAERLTSLQKTSEEHLVRSFTEAGLPLGLTRELDAGTRVLDRSQHEAADEEELVPPPRRRKSTS